MKKVFYIVVFTISFFTKCFANEIPQSSHKLPFNTISIPIVSFKFDLKHYDKKSSASRNVKADNHFENTYSDIFNVLGFFWVVGMICMSVGIPLLGVGIYNYSNPHLQNDNSKEMICSGGIMLGIGFLLSAPTFILSFMLLALIIKYNSSFLHDNKINDLIKNNQIELIIQNIDKGIYDKNNVLLLAIPYGNIDLVKRLITKGANVNYSSDEKSPIGEAIKTNNFEIAKLLYENGATFSISSYNSSYIVKIIENNNFDMLRLFFDRIIALGKNNEIITAAVRSKNLNILKYLFDKGVKTDIQNELYQEALSIGAIEIADYLHDLL